MDNLTLTPKDIEAMGRYLHQENWQKGLAKDLRIDEAVLSSWLQDSAMADKDALGNLIEIVSIRYCTNQIGKAKEKGTFSPAKPLILKPEDNGWSQEVDWAIKQKAITVLKEYNITAMTEI